MSSPIHITRNTVAVVLTALVAGAIGFGAAALLRGAGSLSFLSNVGTILLAAIPALAAYVRGGKIQQEVTAIKEQTNGTTTGLVDITGRAVDALAAIANDPTSRARAAQLLRTIEAEANTPSPPPAEAGSGPVTSPPT